MKEASESSESLFESGLWSWLVRLAGWQEDRKERAKHGLEGDDEDMMEELRKMEAP